MGDREREREGGRADEGGEVEEERGRAVSLLSSEEEDREEREDGGETEDGGVEVGESERAREGGERGQEERRT